MFPGLRTPSFGFLEARHSAEKLPPTHVPLKAVPQTPVTFPPLLAPHPTSARGLPGTHGLALPARKPGLASSCLTVIPSTRSSTASLLASAHGSEAWQVGSPQPGAERAPRGARSSRTAPRDCPELGTCPAPRQSRREHPQPPRSCHNLFTYRAGQKLCQGDTGCFALLSGSDIAAC